MSHVDMLNPDGTVSESYGIEAGQWFRTIDGADVERREPTAQELSDYGQPLLPDLPTGIDLVALADQLAAVSEAVDYLILDSLGGS